MDPVGDSATELYVALVRVVRDLRRAAPSGGVGAGAMSALFSLAKLGPARVSALADHEGVSPASMTRIVDRICELGFAVRTTDPDDGRAHLVSLTDAGRKVVDEGKLARIDVVRRRIAMLSESDREALERLVPVLDRLAETAQGAGSGRAWLTHI